MSRPIPVLLYHSVRPDPLPEQGPLAIDPSLLDAHLTALRDAGATGISVEDLAATLRAGAPLPELPVVITFDDGLIDQLPAAAACAQAGFPATVYVTSGRLGSDGYLDDHALAELAAVPGVNIGGHSVRHRHLDLVRDDDLADEVDACKSTLEDLLQRAVVDFAFPHGSHRGRERMHLQRTGWRSGAAVKNALSHTADDPFGFARVTVTASTTPAHVIELLHGRGAPLAWSRERLRTRAFRHVRRTKQRLGMAT